MCFQYNAKIPAHFVTLHMNSTYSFSAEAYNDDLFFVDISKNRWKCDNSPPVTMQVSFISPPSSYGDVRDVTTSPFSSKMEIFWGGTEIKKWLN